jgi:hypothetical protein
MGFLAGKRLSSSSSGPRKGSLSTLCQERVVVMAKKLLTMRWDNMIFVPTVVLRLYND